MCMHSERHSVNNLKMSLKKCKVSSLSACILKINFKLRFHFDLLYELFETLNIYNFDL